MLRRSILEFPHRILKEKSTDFGPTISWPDGDTLRNQTLLSLMKEHKPDFMATFGKMGVEANSSIWVSVPASNTLQVKFGAGPEGKEVG